jgi:hypothetical protein
VWLVVHAYEFNEVAAGLVANLARVQGALFRSNQFFLVSIGHKFFEGSGRAKLFFYRGGRVNITDSSASSQAKADS